MGQGSEVAEIARAGREAESGQAGNRWAGSQAIGRKVSYKIFTRDVDEPLQTYPWSSCKHRWRIRHIRK